MSTQTITPAPHPDQQLDANLQTLRLLTFVRNHAAFADDALKADQTYQQYLLALTAAEVAQRERNRHTQRIRSARFPVLKELADFDFGAVPSLQKQGVLELARGAYITKAEPVILIGSPGLGKSQPAQYPNRQC